MPRNGSGVFTPPAADYPAVASTLIESAKYNNVVDDLSTAISNSIAANGETTVTANIPMNSKKLTGLAAGTQAGDSVRYEQLTKESIVGLTTADSPHLTAINLGHASDTTLTRVSAGVAAIEGVNILTTATGALKGANSDITSMTGLSAPTVLANPIRATDIQAQTVTAFTTAGTSTAYTLTTLATGLALTTGERWRVKFNSTAGATPTLNRDGKGAVALKLYTSAGAKVAASATTIIANMLTDIEYDGTDYVILNSLKPSSLTSGTKIAASGVTVDFTLIPSWVKRLTLSFASISTNGTSNICVRIGDSGGLDNTGYLGYNGAGYFSSSFIVLPGPATVGVIHGAVVLTLIDAATNLWAIIGNVAHSATYPGISLAGSKALSATLDRISLLTENATDTFDAGSVNILYE